MPDLASHLLTSTVIAALVSAAAILLRELIAARLRKPEVRAESDRQRAAHRVQDRELMLREIESLWQSNARLASRESLCQRRCHQLSRRLAHLENRCAVLRRRLDELARDITSNPPNLNRGQQP